MLTLWAKTSGTWINVFLVSIGTISGLILRHRLSVQMQTIITQAVGLTTIFIGISMAEVLTRAGVAGIEGIVLGLVALVVGGLLGEWWQLELRLVTLGDWIKKRVKGGNRFTDGFVAASLLFCIGPMAILGSLNNGLLGDNTILVVKSTMDGLVSIALTGTYGIGVGFSVFPILLYQGGLSLLSGSLSQLIASPDSNPNVLLVTGVGGIMILGLGFNLLEASKIRVASFIPAIAVAPLLGWFARLVLR